MLGRAWEPLLVKDAKNQLSAHQLHKKEGSGRSLHRAQAETSLRVRLPGALRVMSLPHKCSGREKWTHRQGYGNEYKQEEMGAFLAAES